MGIFDLFKSKEEQKREKDREQKRAMRKAKRGARSFDSDIRKLEQQRDQAFQKAVNAKKAGKLQDVERYKREFKSLEKQIAELSKQAGVWTGKITSLQTMATTSQVASAVGAASEILIGNGVDAETVTDALDSANEVADNLEDVNEAISEEYESQHDGDSDIISDDEFDRMIDAEAAQSIKEESALIEGEAEADGDLADTKKTIESLLKK